MVSRLTYTIVDPGGRRLASASTASGARYELRIHRSVVEHLTVLREGMIVSEVELELLCRAEERGDI